MTDSENQVEANKQRLQSPGVKTDQGKRVVRFNSFKHGLAADKLLLGKGHQGETQEAYDELVESLCEDFRPATSTELFLIHQMAKAMFKLTYRLDAFEVRAFKSDTYPALEQDMFEFVNPVFDLMLRYRQSLENQYYRSLNTLIQMRQVRQMDLFCKSGV